MFNLLYRMLHFVRMTPWFGPRIAWCLSFHNPRDRHQTWLTDTIVKQKCLHCGAAILLNLRVRPGTPDALPWSPRLENELLDMQRDIDTCGDD